MESTARIVVVALLVASAILVARDRRQYAAFKKLEDSVARRRALRRFVLESLAFHGLLSLAILAWWGRLDALFQAPEPMASLGQALRGGDDIEGWRSLLRGMVMGIVAGLAIGPTVLTILGARKAHEEKRRAAPPMAEHVDIEALLPRNAAERRWTTLLSLNAGISEELFFRLLAPFLLNAAGLPALAAVGAATLWFGLSHLYQGWLGVFTTTLVGGLFLFLYAYTGNLWVVMGIHALLDWNTLALGPWMEERLARRRA